MDKNVVRYSFASPNDIPSTIPIPAEIEAILVECNSQYENLLIRNVRNTTVIDRVLSYYNNYNNNNNSPTPNKNTTIINRNRTTGSTPKEEDKKRVEISDRFNIVFLNFDAVSRAHFYRRLYRTQRYIEDVVLKSGIAQVFEFFKYHSVGITTNPNLKAMYIGTNEKEYVGVKV